MHDSGRNICAITNPLANIAMADRNDTTPVKVDAAHVAINVPCENGNNSDPKSDIAVIAGVTPDLKPVDLEYIKKLSNPEDTVYITLTPQRTKMMR
jgi:hypothetical protein